MIEWIVYQFMKKGIRSGTITQEKEEYCLKIYTIRVELVLELLLVLIGGILFRELVHYLIFYLLFVPLRLCCGGNHIKGTWDILFIWGFIVVLMTMLAEIMVRCNVIYPVYVFTDVLSGFFIYKLSPVYDEHWIMDMKHKDRYRRYTGWILLVESVAVNICFAFGFRMWYALKLMTHLAILFLLLTGVLKNALKEHDRREAELWDWGNSK